MKLINIALGSLMLGLVTMPVSADFVGAKKKGGNNECPVGLVSGMTLDDEFGPDSQDLTKCIKKRHQVKMVVQLNQGNGYGLNNIKNIIDDYEITHDMVRGRDYEIVAVLHGPGGMMALKNSSYNGGTYELGTDGKPVLGTDGKPVVKSETPVLVNGRNPSENLIKELMGKGVKFYFCQNTTRAYIGNKTLPDRSDYLATGESATSQMIDGMEYTTAGLTSIADFQAQGYQYIQP